MSEDCCSGELRAGLKAGDYCNLVAIPQQGCNYARRKNVESASASMRKMSINGDDHMCYHVE
jgi:hypothetical protein